MFGHNQVNESCLDTLKKDSPTKKWWGIMAHVFNPRTWKAVAGRFCEFKVILVCIMHLKPVRLYNEILGRGWGEEEEYKDEQDPPTSQKHLPTMVNVYGIQKSL